MPFMPGTVLAGNGVVYMAADGRQKMTRDDERGLARSCGGGEHNGDGHRPPEYAEPDFFALLDQEIDEACVREIAVRAEPLDLGRWLPRTGACKDSQAAPLAPVGARRQRCS